MSNHIRTLAYELVTLFRGGGARQILVSHIYSYSRVLDIVLQFHINFDIARWVSLGVASKSRNTLHLFSFFLFNAAPIHFVLSFVPR